MCPTCLALQTPSALSNLAEKTNALASDDSKLARIVDIDVLSGCLDGNDRRLLSRPGRHMRADLNFLECNVTTTSQTPLSCLSNINVLLSFVSTQLFIKY